MNTLFITGTLKTPEINFRSNGEFTIKGNSYPRTRAIFMILYQNG